MNSKNTALFAVVLFSGLTPLNADMSPAQVKKVVETSRKKAGEKALEAGLRFFGGVLVGSVIRLPIKTKWEQFTSTDGKTVAFFEVHHINNVGPIKGCLIAAGVVWMIINTFRFWNAFAECKAHQVNARTFSELLKADNVK